MKGGEEREREEEGGKASPLIIYDAPQLAFSRNMSVYKRLASDLNILHDHYNYASRYSLNGNVTACQYIVGLL